MAVLPREQVDHFLANVKAKIVLNKVDNLYIVQRRDRKNQNCMAELGLRHNDVADIIYGLDTKNYSETVHDQDYPGEVLWEFGYIYNCCELYIKISLRSNKVVCVSFHQKERDINYPFKM